MNFLNTKQRSRQVWSLHATTRMRAIYLRKSFEKDPSLNIFAWNRSMPSLGRFFKPREAQASQVVYLFQQSNTKRLLNTTAVCVCSWFLLLNVTVKFVNVIFKKPKAVSNIFFFYFRHNQRQCKSANNTQFCHGREIFFEVHHLCHHHTADNRRTNNANNSLVDGSSLEEE